MSLLIFPNTLFEKKYFPKNVKTLIIWEHPQYFKKYNYNKKRLVLHRASLKCYADLMKKYFSIIYIEFHKTPKLGDFVYFDPIDRIENINGKKLQSPNFLLSNELINEYRKKTKNFFFNSFYMWSKKKLDIIPEIKSQDKNNRKTIPKDFVIPNKLQNHSQKDKKYII